MQMHCAVSAFTWSGALHPVTGQNQLIVFARAPEYGCVKQRLARDIGKSAALNFYRRTLQILLQKTGENSHWALTIAVATEQSTAHPLFSGFNVIAQPPGDLGVRMVSVLDNFVSCNRIIIGSDIPHIDPSHLDDAFAALAQHDVVFGPAFDGGFWLVGCRAGFAAGRSRGQLTNPSDRRGFMQQVRWSTEYALSDTIATLPADCTSTTVQTLADVDDGDSYQRYLQSCSQVHGIDGSGVE